MDGADEIGARIAALAAISETPGGLTRGFLTSEHRRASALVRSWMQEAGMTAGMDAIGNMVGRYEGEVPGRPALVLGSHLDTVRDAGAWDGMLGVLAAIACVADLHRAGRRLPFAVEVIGFGDEEGLRFGATMLGSRALAGTFDPALLACRDAAGIDLATALRDFGLDPAAISGAARQPEELLAYAELHIEQGPVLEAAGLPAGCVSAIAGAMRYEVEVRGMAGHAGTVPMAARRDALAAAAECVLAVETRCRREAGLVGTVGVIEASPGAVNVIPGRARFTLDLRAPEDAVRRRAAADLLAAFAVIAERRGVELRPRLVHELAAVPCAPWLMDQIDAAIAGRGIAPLRLASGAGHDGMALAAIAEIGMIFVRCRGGVSHHPDEFVSPADAATGVRVLLDFVRNFQPRPGGKFTVETGG